MLTEPVGRLLGARVLGDSDLIDDYVPKWNDTGVDGQLIAGSAYGLIASTATLSPQFYVHLAQAPGVTTEVPDDHAERAVFITTGAVELAGATYAVGRMLMLGTGTFRLRAVEASTSLDP